jgi:hypothetical protein
LSRFVAVLARRRLDELRSGLDLLHAELDGPHLLPALIARTRAINGESQETWSGQMGRTVERVLERIAAGKERTRTSNRSTYEH